MKWDYLDLSQFYHTVNESWKAGIIFGVKFCWGDHCLKIVFVDTIIRVKSQIIRKNQQFFF